MKSLTGPLREKGSVTDHINVEISFQIIGLFSEGLYSSPNKAIEELVSNAFDADATKVQVVLPPDRASDDASIAVIDNGTGMDDEGLKIHWIVGDSIKSVNRLTPGGRRTIGKFGIGKLAAYVLGNRLTHVSKARGRYFATSMDFSSIPKTVDISDISAGSRPSPQVTLDLRELTESEAAEVMSPWSSIDPALEEIRLFGDDAEESWTAAIISDLKPMAVDLSPGMLRWVLSTAMPLRDDFALYLNKSPIASSKLGANRIGSWVLGKDINTIPKPGPAELETDVDTAKPKEDYKHWLLVDSLLGPISGYVEIFEAPIDTGKSLEMVGRSNGFFVYVHGRLINPEDAGFGIDRNILRHGTFSRFRVVINIDRLDNELRSSRESLREGPALTRARHVLQGIFNFARTRLESHLTENSTERRASQRLAESPASLAERPILRLLLDSFDGNFMPRHLRVPSSTDFEDKDELQTHVEDRLLRGEGLVSEIAYVPLGTSVPMCILDAANGELSINLEHPFVAHFADEFGDRKKNLPLQLFAMAEILLEAELHDAGAGTDIITSVLERRDELLRHLARESGAQNSLTVAQELVNAAGSAKDLESALVVAFRQLGYEAVPKAGKNEADGIAEAFLAGDDGGPSHYRVSLEAKSKEKPGGKVKKKAVEVSTIARHRKDATCDHALVVGPDFETGPDDLGAVVQEIDDDREKNKGKSITLMRIKDLARLVRVAPLKRINLGQLRELFEARTPDEAAEWVDKIANAEAPPAPYKDILETVWQIQKDDKEHSVEYGSLRTALRMSERLIINDTDLRHECSALSRMAPNLFFAKEDRVELEIHPDKVLEVIHDYVERVPGAEGG